MSEQNDTPEAEGSKTSLIVFSIIALIVAFLAINSWRVRSGWLRDIKSDDAAVRKTAAEAMMRRGQVAEQLQGQPPSIRVAAVRALADVRSPDAATEIIQFRKDPDDPVKELAKAKLVEMGPDIVQKPAMLALESSDDAIGGGVQDVLKDGQFTKTDHPDQGDMPLIAHELMHPDARNNAQNILTDLKTPAIPYVIPYLHPDPSQLIGTSTVEDVQLTAIHILDNQKDPKAISAIPALIEMLKYQHTQRDAVGALGRMPPENTKEAILPLLKVLKENPLIRTETVVALGLLADPRAVPSLVQLLSSYSEELRGGAAEALRRIGPPSVPALLTAAKSADVVVRGGAIRALGGIQNPAAQSATIAALKDADAGVRIQAARGLGELKEPAGIPALVAALTDKDGRVGAEAARSLAAIGKPAVPALIAALKAPPLSPQAYFAQRALHDIGPDAQPALAAAVRTGDDTTARFAALLLGDMGTQGPGIAALRAAAQRPSPDVQWAARRSLGLLLGSTSSEASSAS
jgi:HEAT repeat protein